MGWKFWVSSAALAVAVLAASVHLANKPKAGSTANENFVASTPISQAQNELDVLVSSQSSEISNEQVRTHRPRLPAAPQRNTKEPTLLLPKPAVDTNPKTPPYNHQLLLAIHSEFELPNISLQGTGYSNAQRLAAYTRQYRQFMQHHMTRKQVARLATRLNMSIAHSSKQLNSHLEATALRLAQLRTNL